MFSQMQNIANKNIYSIGLLWMWTGQTWCGRWTFHVSTPNFYSGDLTIIHFCFRQENTWIASTDSFLFSPLKSSKEFLHSEAGVVYLLVKSTGSGICGPASPLTSCVTPMPYFTLSVKWDDNFIIYLSQYVKNAQNYAWNIQNVQ